MKIISLSVLLALSAGNFQNSAAEVVPVKLTSLKEPIQVYPTPYNAGSITISSANTATLDFYLFDLEGNLIYQTTIRKNEKKTADGLTKGTYLYNAFQNDENIKGGKVILK
jgi:hypothetical protein